MPKSANHITSTHAPVELVYTVSQLNTEARFLLEEGFKTIWIAGEISNLSRPSSGHCYFSLKDEQAQVRCAFFRHAQRRLNFNLDNGLQVLLQAQVSLYETRGDYQLIVSHVEVAGVGNLQLAFEQLKQRLAKAGLFASEHKKPLPTLPGTIGVVTSPTGAAIRDILKVLKQRFPAINVIIYPTAVQGEKAAPEIAAALHIANQRRECEVILLARGGGSLEDLWPFNEEMVAHAIFASKIPVVTGIGHEIDITIADLVADHRAATPSAAAAAVSPDQQEWQPKLQTFYYRLRQMVINQLRHAQLQLTALQQRLKHPGQSLQSLAQRLDQLEHRLFIAMRHHLAQQKQQLQSTANALQAISPLATLSRGYAIIQQRSTQKIIRIASEIKIGDAVTAKLAHGSLNCRVEEISSE